MIFNLPPYFSLVYLFLTYFQLTVLIFWLWRVTIFNLPRSYENRNSRRGNGSYNFQFTLVKLCFFNLPDEVTISDLPQSYDFSIYLVKLWFQFTWWSYWIYPRNFAEKIISPGKFKIITSKVNWNHNFPGKLKTITSLVNWKIITSPISNLLWFS